MKIGQTLKLDQQPEIPAGEYHVVAKGTSHCVGSESKSTVYSLRNVDDGSIHHIPEARGLVK